ncbi:MAG: glycosyltransferase family 1 protein [Chloroflexi bacterium]|nr:MAG: glycosyltransferase family 1 protein [Chloroflexota bacterium]
MRVLHVAKVTGIAGAENHLLALLPALRALGVDAEVVLLQEPGRPVAQLVRAFLAAGVPTFELAINMDLDPWLVGRLARLVRSRGAHAVHTHGVHADLYGRLCLQGLDGVLLLQTRHNDDRFRRLWIMRLLNQWLARRCVRIVAISDAVREFVCAVEGIPPRKVERIYYGLDAAPAPQNVVDLRTELGWAGAPLIGFVGRLTGQKGVDVLLNAFAIVHRALPTARLLLIGDGPQRAALAALAGGLQISAAVHFAGWREDARAQMAALNVLAIASRWEGFGLVTLEAMQAGVAVVASRVSALPEIVLDGETGLLVPAANAAKLAAALLALLQDPQRAMQLGENGRLRAAQLFTVKQMAVQHAALYLSLAAPAAAAGRAGK